MEEPQVLSHISWASRQPCPHLPTLSQSCAQCPLCGRPSQAQVQLYRSRELSRPLTSPPSNGGDSTSSVELCTLGNLCLVSSRSPEMTGRIKSLFRQQVLKDHSA